MGKPQKAVIAMSGGVDSSVAAYLMCKQGYECVGMTMKLFHNEDVGIEAAKTCCSASDADDARRVARLFDMPFYVVNFTQEFQKEVIDRFVDTYIAGGTPDQILFADHPPRTVHGRFLSQRAVPRRISSHKRDCPPRKRDLKQLL